MADSNRSGSSTIRGLRRAIREENQRRRKLTMQHRWYAGGIATLLAGALIFTGVAPAVAATPEPTPTPTSTESTPPADESTPPAEEATPPAEETTPPGGGVDPACRGGHSACGGVHPACRRRPPRQRWTPAEPAEEATTPPDEAKEEPPASVELFSTDELISPLALIAACTTNCSTIVRNVNVVGGGPATELDWEYRATAGADWYVLPAGAGGIAVTRQPYVVSATSLSANTANYVTTVVVHRPGSQCHLEWHNVDAVVQPERGPDVDMYLHPDLRGTRSDWPLRRST